MAIKRVTIEEAESILKKYGLVLVFLTTCRITNNKYDALIADYTDMDAYGVAYAVDVFNLSTEERVERFNIMK